MISVTCRKYTYYFQLFSVFKRKIVTPKDEFFPFLTEMGMIYKGFIFGIQYGCNLKYAHKQMKIKRRKNDMKIVAITACPAGIAHTYMSATRLEVIAKEMGHTIKVEKQGAKGLENELTALEIKEADVVIFAVDTKVKQEERFKGKSIYRCSVSAPIKDAHQVIEDALSQKETKVKIGTQIKNHILTGVSYMIPVVIGASLIMAIARVSAMAFGIGDIWLDTYAQEGIIGFLHTLDGLGGTALGLMLPVFAGFISYSIADKQGLAAGLAGGLLAKEIGAGFFGALAAGFFAGYLSQFLVNKLQFKGAASGLNAILMPLLSMLLTLLAIHYIIGVPFIWLNEGLISFLTSMSGSNAIIVAFIVGAMMGSDLGGPINKAAMVTSMGLIESGIYAPNTAAMIAIVIPTLGYGLVTLLKGKNFTEEFKNAGSASFVMGLVGVSEGAIPFTLANPKILVPANMLGCGVGAALAVALGALNITTLSGCYGWLLVQNWPVYVLGIVVGSAIIAGAAFMCRKSFEGE